MMKWARGLERQTSGCKLIGVLGVLVGALAFASACNSGECQDGGRTYEDGQNWTCSDGCNTCDCRDGEVAQTAIACAKPPGPAAGKLKCFEGNVWHIHGETWAMGSGCTHSCDDGQVVGDCR